MAKISEDGLSLRLEPREAREIAEDIADELVGPPRRAGFARRECIGGKHPIGTDPGCASCIRYKAGSVVRKG